MLTVESHLPTLSESEKLLLDELEMLESSMTRTYEWVWSEIRPFLGRKVLEVGSGVGVLSKFLVEEPCTAILSDYHPAYVAHLREKIGDRPNVSYRLLDLNDRHFDLEGDLVDTILCLNVLEHLRDDQHVLEQLATLLMSHGRLVLQVPNHTWLYGSLDESYGHYRRYAKRGLGELLERTGFEILELRNFNPFAIPGWILSGKILRARRLSPRLTSLFNGMVPVLRRLTPLSRVSGLALLAFARKRT